MSDSPSSFNRRDFLQASLFLPATYSLYVKLDEENLENIEPLTVEEQASTYPSHTLLADQRFDGEPHMKMVDLACDFLVVGGGLSGVCATLAAARHGAKIILVQDRSRLGGNSSSEIKMHVVGANNHTGRPGWREGGILEELRLDDAVNNPHRSWEMWDLLLYDKVKSEPNVQLILDTTVYAAEVKDGAISQVMARCDKTETLYRIKAKYFSDCTGDGRLALEAGATMRWGHESRDEFKEPLAWDKPSKETLGSSILFTARDYGEPIPFKAPAWARKIEEKHLRFRPIGSFEYGYWWIEWGGKYDTIKDNEMIRHELLAIVTGVWDYIKNSGKYPEAANWGMDWVGMIPGKRESRRIEGDHILTQQDLMGLNGDFEDAVAIGGWPLDEHPPGGFDDVDKPPFVSIKLPEVYNIPLRSLYSKDLSNMFMAGRNASCSHVAFTSTRVMATCAVMGQAVGTAAALCNTYNIMPKALYQDKSKLTELQQTLLKDDQSIKNLLHSDPNDLARQAKVTSSEVCENSKAEHILTGYCRDMEDTHNHRWAAPMGEQGAWITLSWEQPVKINHIQLTFDTGFHRELTLTSHDGHNSHIIRAPQPETIKHYRIIATQEDGTERVVAEVENNHQRINRHDFEPVDASSIKVEVVETQGAKEARIYEVRCYG